MFTLDMGIFRRARIRKIAFKNRCCTVRIILFTDFKIQISIIFCKYVMNVVHI